MDANLEKTMLSKDEAWKKIAEIRDFLRSDEELGFRKSIACLNLNKHCIDMWVLTKNEELSDYMREKLSGVEFFSGFEVSLPEATHYALYKVPYNPADSRPYVEPKDQTYPW